MLVYSRKSRRSYEFLSASAQRVEPVYVWPQRRRSTGLCIIWVAILLDVISMLTKNTAVSGVVGMITTVLVLWALFRVFSRNLEKRRAENAAFLQKVWWPIKRRFNSGRQQRMDKEHKYFTCPNCKTVCRVPVGKGKIVITCPKCGREIHGKS